MITRPAARRAVLAAWDAFCWIVATALVIGARYDFEINRVQLASALAYCITAIVLSVALGYALKFYRGRYRVASFDETLGLVVLFGLVGFITLVLFVGIDDALPRGIAFLVPPIALMGAAGCRWFVRVYRTRGQGREEAGTKNVVIYGAGDAGYQLLRLIRTDQNSSYRVVGFIDDYPAKRNLRLMGVPVLGDRANLPDAAIEAGAGTVILAITASSGEFIGEVQDIVEGAGLEFLVLPALTQLIGGRVTLGDVRKVDISDVLGRHQVTTDLASIAEYLTGRRVMITGAGGSIGSELARQVHRFGPGELIMLDRDESALHAVQLSIYGRGLLDSPDVVLADIRDIDALRPVFERLRPEIIFHTAALKHLPLLEQYPEEGWKTNVLGTLNLLTLAQEHGVAHFVNISTDKAADPTSVLGRTKRIAEELTAWQAENATGSYISVRFGNVLGSRGSMLHAFNSQIESDSPVTVTHPDVTRYFMTIPEACELVIQAGAIGEAGEVLVLEMGSPIRILDVARRMIARSGKDIDIIFTGLRPGEKLHEDLFGADEHRRPTAHPLISSVDVPALSPAALDTAHPKVGLP